MKHAQFVSFLSVLVAFSGVAHGQLPFTVTERVEGLTVEDSDLVLIKPGDLITHVWDPMAKSSGPLLKSRAALEAAFEAAADPERAGVGLAVPTSIPRYTAMESMDTISAFIA